MVSVLPKPNTKYKSKHVKIPLKKEYYNEIREAAHRAHYTISAFVYELFKRYGDKVVNELISERESKSSKEVS